MIVERALMSITPGSEADFEAAMQQAKGVISQANGFRSIRVTRGIESPSTYLLILEWDTLEDHTVGFRESELFIRWRGLIGQYFAEPPAVEHYTPIDEE
ncbi:MAG: antibiotic biosynthesis monooxygenase family protein [Solirubrobacteraceae bacterium]